MIKLTKSDVFKFRFLSSRTLDLRIINFIIYKFLSNTFQNRHYSDLYGKVRILQRSRRYSQDEGLIHKSLNEFHLLKKN